MSGSNCGTCYSYPCLCHKSKKSKRDVGLAGSIDMMLSCPTAMPGCLPTPANNLSSLVYTVGSAGLPSIKSSASGSWPVSSTSTTGTSSSIAPWPLPTKRTRRNTYTGPATSTKVTEPSAPFESYPKPPPDSFYTESDLREDAPPTAPVTDTGRFSESRNAARSSGLSQLRNRLGDSYSDGSGDTFPLYEDVSRHQANCQYVVWPKLQEFYGGDEDRNTYAVILAELFCKAGSYYYSIADRSVMPALPSLTRNIGDKTATINRFNTFIGELEAVNNLSLSDLDKVGSVAENLNTLVETLKREPGQMYTGIDRTDMAANEW